MWFIKKENKTGILRLDGDLTIERAEELLEICRESLAVCDKIEVEFVSPGEIDLSCLQLLCAAHRTAVSGNKEFVFAGGRPEVLTEAGREGGFIRRQKCQMNPDRSDCLWLGGKENE
jgi:ABC-type transporter Mla MlaB component